MSEQQRTTKIACANAEAGGTAQRRAQQYQNGIYYSYARIRNTYSWPLSARSTYHYLQPLIAHAHQSRHSALDRYPLDTKTGKCAGETYPPLRCPSLSFHQ